MEGYLGVFPVEVSKTEYANWGPQDWALYWIAMYGGIDGDHHKTWVLDQVARILHGTPVIVTERRWENGHHEFSFETSEPPSAGYDNWVVEVRNGEDGPETYDYNIGIAP